MASGLLIAAGPAAGSEVTAPHLLTKPGAGPAEPIGSYANGCLRGSVALPAEGPGYQVLNLSRRRNHGHPHLIEYLQTLAGRVQRDGIGTLAIGDMTQIRGGRMVTGHASHQIGLDADIWFALDLPPLPVAAREREDLPSMVDTKRQRVTSGWGAGHVRLLHLAAADARVTRIFVNPAIKLALCEQVTGDRAWLNKVRPWFGHAAHLHVRLACPADVPACQNQEPPPPGDGCDAELMSWFDPPPPPGPAQPPKPPPPPPAACLALYAE